MHHIFKLLFLEVSSIRIWYMAITIKMNYTTVEKKYLANWLNIIQFCFQYMNNQVLINVATINYG